MSLWNQTDLEFIAELRARSQRAVSTLGHSSTSQLKHYRALQINHACLCQEKRGGKQQESFLSAELKDRSERISSAAIKENRKREGVRLEGRTVAEKEKQKGDSEGC